MRSEHLARLASREMKAKSHMKALMERLTCRLIRFYSDAKIERLLGMVQANGMHVWRARGKKHYKDSITVKQPDGSHRTYSALVPLCGRRERKKEDTGGIMMSQAIDAILEESVGAINQGFYPEQVEKWAKLAPGWIEHQQERKKVRARLERKAVMAAA